MASSDDVAQFVSITGADAETAKFYLDSAGGNAEAALSAYFESGGAMGSGPVGEGAEEEPVDDPDFQPGVLHSLAFVDHICENDIAYSIRRGARHPLGVFMGRNVATALEAQAKCCDVTESSKT
jgi:UBA-like domain